MGDVPERAKLWLDDDVARWLHFVADDRYQGDVGRAMNVMLRVAMKVHENPERPWSAILYEDGTSRQHRK